MNAYLGTRWGAMGTRRHRWSGLAIGAACLAAACFSPAPYTEYLCRDCTSTCPEGLLCRGERCVRACDASCNGDHTCMEGACVPISGEEECSEQTVNLGLCVGQPVENVIEPSKGRTGETWVVLDSQLPDGLYFDHERGVLLGSPTQAGRGSLSARLGERGRQRLSLEVLATERCPVIQSRELSFCIGQQATEPLIASPPGDYEWHLSSLPAGIEQRGASLSGRSDVSGTWAVRATLYEGGWRRDEATLALAATECPGGEPPAGPPPASPHPAPVEPPPSVGPYARDGDSPIVIAPPPASVREPLDIVTADLPRACVGEPYHGRLEASGGGGDYRWQLFGEPPAGLSLDAQGVLSGTPTSDELGERLLTVAVTSSLNDSPVRSPVGLRLAVCDGLAYVTDDLGVARLFLSSPSTERSWELSQGLLTADETVDGFAMAPGAPRLAFEVTGSGGESRLYWADLSTTEVRPVALDPDRSQSSSVLEYHWSRDGQYLASIQQAGDALYLNVSPFDASAPGSRAHVTDRYLSGLFWTATRVCYTAPGSTDETVNVLCHAVSPNGIEDQSSSEGLFAEVDARGSTLVDGNDGYLTILADGRRALYHDVEGAGSAASHIDRAFSPGLRWAAGVRDAPPAQVWTTAGRSSLVASLDGCEDVHAWSSDERWLACRSGEQLSIHQLSGDGVLIGGGLIEESSVYTSGEFRRVFAPSGQWYAYATGSALRVVPLVDAERRSVTIFDGGESLYAGLGVGPSGTHLFYHHGSDLDVVDAATLARRNLNGAVLLSDPLPCASTYLEAGPRLWCGSSKTPAFFFPSPDAARVAFVDRQNLLYVVDIEAGSIPRQAHPSAVKCRTDSGETVCDAFVQWAPR
jgi:hypothetical protein